MTVIKVQRNEIQQRVINVDTHKHTYIYTVSMARSESCTLQSHQKLLQSSSISTTTTSNVQQNATKEEKKTTLAKTETTAISKHKETPKVEMKRTNEQ